VSEPLHRVEKPWGYELWWARTDRYVGKQIHINKGHALSLQYHNKKDETIFVWSGKILFERREGETLVARGLWRPRVSGTPSRQVFQLHPGAWRFAAGHGANVVDDPGKGQGEAVVAALAVAEEWPGLAVNAGVPAAQPRDPPAPLGAMPGGGAAGAGAGAAARGGAPLPPATRRGETPEGVIGGGKRKFDFLRLGLAFFIAVGLFIMGPVAMAGARY